MPSCGCTASSARPTARPPPRGRPVVLEVEIDVARGMPGDPPDLAAHPHPAELALEHALHRAGDLRDAELRRVLARPRVLEELHPPRSRSRAGTIRQPSPTRQMIAIRLPAHANWRMIAPHFEHGTTGMARDIPAGTRHDGRGRRRGLRPRRPRAARRPRLVPGRARSRPLRLPPQRRPATIRSATRCSSCATKRATSVRAGTRLLRSASCASSSRSPAGAETSSSTSAATGPTRSRRRRRAARARSATRPATSPSASTGSTARRSTRSPAAVAGASASSTSTSCRTAGPASLRRPVAPSDPPAGTTYQIRRAMAALDTFSRGLRRPLPPDAPGAPRPTSSS